MIKQYFEYINKCFFKSSSYDAEWISSTIVASLSVAWLIISFIVQAQYFIVFYFPDGWFLRSVRFFIVMNFPIIIHFLWWKHAKNK